MTGLDLIAYEDTVVSREVHEQFKQARKFSQTTKAELIVFALP
jgi:hypothetical protein